MAFDIYTPAELRGVIDVTYKPTQFLTNYFFGTVETFDGKAVMFDRISGARKLAPFVSPCVEGRPVRRNGFSTDSFTPAYVKPKMALTPCDSTKRRPGEAIGGEFTLAQRRDLQLADDLNYMTGLIDNRIEWMSAQALVHGYVDVVGDDYPLVRVDFQRAGTHQVALAGANLWSASATAAPVSNLDAWANTVSMSQGGSVTDVICGTNVWAQFARSAEVKDLYKNVQNPGGPLPSLLPSVMDNEQKIYRGQFGQFRFWSYNATYTDDAGNSQFFVPPNDVILVAKQSLQGVQAYGAIMDHESLNSGKFFAKMWKQEDPSVVNSMVQSAPLMVPRSVNSTFRATVL